MADPKMNKWTPTTDLRTLRRLGKLQEELGELQAVVARCIIQGIEEVDPASGKTNRVRLTHEAADVLAQLGLTREQFNLDEEVIFSRVASKTRQMAEWEALFQPAQAGADRAGGLSPQVGDKGQGNG